VVYNLVSNAIKFTMMGKIGVRAVMHGQEVEISVWDTGIGIDISNYERIFDKFFQVESNYDKSYSGAGLGLALAKAIVDLQGGRIWVESEGKGRGSVFKFTLPVTVSGRGKNG